MINSNDLNIRSIQPIITPEELKKEYPASDNIFQLTLNSRETISSIIHKKDKRMLVVVGPCSIHDPEAAIDYAERLKELQARLADTMFIVMRVYFEKPRTALGWRGLIIDPDLDGSYNLEKGLRLSRNILISILNLGLPIATEMLDPIIPQYIADLISWSAIGARTSESQIHRELASGLSMPVGFKNGTDGDADIAINAMISSQSQHSFIGIDQSGRTCIVNSKGNRDAHIILRGGKNGPNYYDERVEDTEEALIKRGANPAIVIDCSHANSGKEHVRQIRVLRSAIRQRIEFCDSIVGIMLESNIFPGRQDLNSPLAGLKYGISITDECLGWEQTENALLEANKKLEEIFRRT